MKFSIVTPSFNPGRFLDATRQSILSQSGDVELEWIVADGGSTDGSRQSLAALASTDPRVQLIAEPDAGQADAVNKGLARASGDVVGWLNADDCYLPGALSAVNQAFIANPATRWVVGQCRIIDAAGREIRPGITRYKNRQLKRYTRRALIRQNFISQPAVFWRSDFGREVGPLDPTLHYTMDYDLWLRMSASSEPLILPQLLAEFRLYADSKSGQVRRQQFDEQYQVASRYFGNDRISRYVHRANVEKIVWAYRVMRLLKR